MRLFPLYFGCVLVALPWLNPFAGGPTAAMVPWLVSLSCVGACAALVAWCGEGAKGRLANGTAPRRAGLSRYVLWFFAANAVYFVLRTAVQMFADDAGPVAGSEVAATVVAWGCVALMAWVGVALSNAGTGSVDKNAAENTDTNAPQLMHCGARALAATWLVVALVSVGMALVQYLQLEQWAAPWVSHSADGVAYANLRQRNQFATLCGVGLLALLYLQQTCAAPAILAARQKRWSNAWPWAALAVLALGNALSSSRTGALQWVLVAAAVLCWRGSLRASVLRLGLASLAVYALAVALMPWLAQAVGNTSTGLLGRAQEASVASAAGATGDARWWLYSNVLDLIAQKPWLGWGWRELAYAHYSTPFNVRFTELLDNAHNLPLHLAVELGAPYAMVFCAVVLTWIFKARPWRETAPVRQLAWGVLMLLGVHSMVEYPLWYGPFLMTLGLCIGLLQVGRPVAYSKEEFWKKKWQFSDVDIKKYAIKIISIALLVGTAYLAFDYHRLSQIYTAAEDRSPRYASNALGAAQQSAVFAQQARFAELVTTPVTAQTAPRVLALASALVHYSPEPRVIEPLIESAVMLHFDDVAMFHISRYKVMYPQEYAAWTALK
jgi:Virulence factor membrane-bound polymerase, C-terminal/O-Antigen ligase/Protein glycosylation ligase